MNDVEQYHLTPGGFGQLRVNSVDDLLEFLRELQDRRRFIFRGQSNAEWGLESKIERKIPDAYKRIVGIQRLELEILNRFKRRAHHYLRSADVPHVDDDLEWLALIQHYGGPTRLLDFTKSVFVAAHFAVGTLNQSDEAAIWAINWHYMEMNFAHKRTEHAQQIESAENAVQCFGDEFTSHTFLSASIQRLIGFNAALSVEPFRQNRRLLQQQGLFVFPLNINCRFEENIAAMFGPALDLSIPTPNEVTLRTGLRLDDFAVIKMVIAKPTFPQFQTELRQMNIATETLFPDLEGEARALAEIVTEHVFVKDVLCPDGGEREAAAR